MPLLAQPGERPTAAAVRAMAKAAQAEGRGDNSAIVLALDKRVRDRWGDFESFPISLVRRQDLTISLSTPYMTYRRGVIEHLRMREALSAVPWIDTAVIGVGPNRLDAPDIVRIVVERGGQTIAPEKNLLRPMQFTSGTGETAALHAGDVHYPMSAFVPGADVRIIATPASGEPFVFTLADADLRLLK